MKKILGFLPLLMLITSGVGSVVSCEMVTNGQNHQKVPITNENLRIFFAENKIFEYQGEFFFKDELEQTAEDKYQMINDGSEVTNLHNFLLDQTFGEKFRSYFFYVPFEYQFTALNLETYSGYRLGQTYDITFNVLIKSNKNKIDFKQNDLVLKFTETSQYPEQKWLMQYVDYFINLSNEIWIKKYDGSSNNFNIVMLTSYLLFLKSAWVYYFLLVLLTLFIIFPWGQDYFFHNWWEVLTYRIKLKQCSLTKSIKSSRIRKKWQQNKKK